jgi:hypothetical protein
VRFDGTGGKTGKNSGVTIDDSNNVTGFATLATSGAATLASLVCTAGGTFGGGTGSTGATIDTDGVGTFDGVLTGLTVEATGDTAAGDNAAMGYESADGLVLTGQGSTNDVTIKNDADGTVLEIATGGTDVEITSGNLIIGTSGKGIDFSATADSAGTMASEVLDDYEEGAWTPVIKYGGHSGTAYAQTVTGRYTKVGNIVAITAAITITNPEADDSGSNTVAITGLPYNVVNHTIYSRTSTQWQYYDDANAINPDFYGVPNSDRLDSIVAYNNDSSWGGIFSAKIHRASGDNNVVLNLVYWAS